MDKISETAKATEEVGTNSQVVSGLMARSKKKSVTTIDIVPGQDGLPEKRTTPYTYTHEKRRMLVAKAAEVGKAKIRKAYGLRNNTLYNWETVIKRQDKKEAENPVSETMPTESLAVAHTARLTQMYQQSYMKSHNMRS